MITKECRVLEERSQCIYVHAIYHAKSYIEITLLYTPAKISFCTYKTDRLSSRDFIWIRTLQLEKTQFSSVLGEQLSHLFPHFD